MSEHMLSNDSIKDTQCPICMEFFNSSLRIPKCMTCCNQPICNICLDTYIGGKKSLTCPMCRQINQIPFGVKSIPKDDVVLKILKVLQTSKNVLPICTDCPDHNPAMAKCNKCDVCLCKPCLDAHGRHRISRDHSTITIDDIRNQPEDENSSFLSPSYLAPSSLDIKLKRFNDKVDKLTVASEKLEESQKRTSNQINEYFDDLISELQQRRRMLLMHLHSNVKRYQHSIDRTIQYTKAEAAQLSDPRHKERGRRRNASFEDATFTRRCVSFMADNKEALTSIIRSSGAVRTVTFEPRDLMAEENDQEYVRLDHDQLSKRSVSDQVLLLNENPIICPDLRYDMDLSSNTLSISGNVVTNSIPDEEPIDTGCRLQSRRVFLSKSFPFEGINRCLYVLRCQFNLKQTIPDGFMIWENALNTMPQDVNRQQHCMFHMMVRSNKIFNDVNVMSLAISGTEEEHVSTVFDNKATGGGVVHLAVMLNSTTQKVHVVDVESVHLLASVNVSFTEPLWSTMYVGRQEYSDIRVEMVTGKNVRLSGKVLKLLFKL